MKRLTGALVVLSVVTCGGDTTAPAPPESEPASVSFDMDGSWHSSFPEGSEFLATMEVLDADGMVTGTGEKGIDCDSWQVDGQRDEDRFSLRWECPGFLPFTYSGEVVIQEPEARDKLVGSVTGSGADGEALVMLRN